MSWKRVRKSSHLIPICIIMAIARSTSAAPKGNAFVGTEGIYNLPHHRREIDRLQRQHNFILSSTGGLLLSIPVETNATLRILDAGAADGKWKGGSPSSVKIIPLTHDAGVGTWLRSLAQHYPDQKWSLHGIDIGSALFPPPSADGPIVDLQKHDIRKPIPKHLHLPESFDIVHQRYLIWGLKSSEWPQAVGNLRSVLKPGGWIQLVEAQWVDRDTPFDPVKFPTLAKMTEFERWSTAAFGMNAYIAYELEDLLSDLGFRNIKKTSFALGYGAMAREEQWKVTSAHILVEGFRSLGHKMPPGGIPGVARTPAEYDAFLDELRDDVIKHGYAPQLNIVIGQKPSERALASL